MEMDARTNVIIGWNGKINLSEVAELPGGTPGLWLIANRTSPVKNF